MLKAVHRSNVKEFKTFMMRNVNATTIHSVNDLKALIKENFEEDIRRNFDVGYVQGNSVIRVRSKEDLFEMQTEVKKSKGSLWCDGLAIEKKSTSRKRLFPSDNESDEEPPRKSKKKHQEKDEKVQEIVDTSNTKQALTVARH